MSKLDFYFLNKWEGLPWSATKDGLRGWGSEDQTHAKVQIAVTLEQIWHFSVRKPFCSDLQPFPQAKMTQAGLLGKIPVEPLGGYPYLEGPTVSLFGRSKCKLTSMTVHNLGRFWKSCAKYYFEIGLIIQASILYYRNRFLCGNNCSSCNNKFSH